MIYRGCEFEEIPDSEAAPAKTWRESPVYHPRDIGRAFRTLHPSHARHGIVRHEKVDGRAGIEGAFFIVVCECRQHLKVEACYVLLAEVDNSGLFGTLSNGPAKSCDLTIDDLLIAKRRIEKLAFAPYGLPPEPLRLELVYRGLPVPHGTFGFDPV